MSIDTPERPNPRPQLSIIRTGVVDVHRRAYYLTEQGHADDSAFYTALRELRKYDQMARCDRCAVLKTELHAERDHSGRFVAVCSLCQKS